MKSKRANSHLISELSKMQSFEADPTSRRNSDSLAFLWGIRTLVVLAVLLFSMNVVRAADVTAEMTLIGDAVNVEFEGRSDWPYTLNRKGSTVEISVPHIDAKTRSRLLSWKGPLIQKIEIKKDTDDKDLIVFTVSKNNVQTFDYLTDQPSRLVVDFFTVDEKAPAAKKEEPKSTTLESKVTVAEKVAIRKRSPAVTQLPKKGQRSPASSELLKTDAGGQEEATAEPGAPAEGKGIFDGGDPQFTRFAIKDYEINPASIIASQQNIYIRFPMLTSEDDSLAKLIQNKPVYEIKPEDSDENKKARFLQLLFNNKRYAVFLRMIDFYRQAYPESKYNELLRYMEADVYHELFQRDHSLSDFQTAMAKYKALTLDFPKSALAERTQLLLGYSFRERGDVLGALSELESYTRKYPQSQQRHQVKLAIADSYAKIHKYEDAERILKEIEADPVAGDYAAAAAYKRADVYFERKDFEQAIKTYSENRKKFAGSDLKYPSALYNTAEVLFWQGDYKKSLDMYREFLQKFPTSSHGGYAMTRIGELMEILGANNSKIAGAYLESLFRYRGSQGAGVANIRLTRERMKDMKPKEIEAAVKEVKAFTKTSDLPKIKDFEILMLADGYFDRSEYEKSLGLLQGFFRENPTSINLDVFKNRIVKTVTQQVKSTITDKKYIEAFQLYAKNANTWLKGSDRIDLKHYLGKAYEGLGVPSEASIHYREALNKRYAIVGTKDEDEKKVFEDLPSVDELNLRLAAVSERQKDLPQTGKYISDIKQPQLLTPDQQIERTSLSSKVARAKGDLSGAEGYLNELISKWKGQPEKLVPSYLELAQLQHDQKKYNEALLSLEKIEAMHKDTGIIPDELHAKSLELKAEILLAEGKKDEAIATYQELLEAYELSTAMGSTRYKTGKLLFEQGKTSEAEKVWSALSTKPENKVWAQLAKEQITHSQWKQDYKKYLNRIPAMNDQKGSEK